MKYWLLLFHPDTYEFVRKRGVIGVLERNGPRFQALREGDRFITYVSRLRILDGHGVVTSDPFEDTNAIAEGWERYPHRANVRFVQEGAGKDAKELIWGFSPFDENIKTTPANLLFCKGGFLEISESDYDWAIAELGKGS